MRLKLCLLSVLFLLVLSDHPSTPTDDGTDDRPTDDITDHRPTDDVICPAPSFPEQVIRSKCGLSEEDNQTEGDGGKSPDTGETQTGKWPKKKKFIGLQTLIFRYFYTPIKKFISFLFEEVDSDTHFVMKKGLNDDKVKSYKCLPTNHSSSAVHFIPEGDLVNEMNSTTACGFVLFYSTYCRFSVQVLPSYKALARVYPSLNLLAVKINSYSSSSIQFGAVGTPTIMLFHNSRPIQKMPAVVTSLRNMSSYVVNITDLRPVGPVELLEGDSEGVELLHSFDWALLFSVVFLAATGCYNLFTTTAGQRILTILNINRI